MLPVGAKQLEKQLHKLGHRETCVDVRIVKSYSSLLLTSSSQQPWSTYALHIATFTSLSFVFDPLIIFLTIKATAPYSSTIQLWALIAQLAFMSASKVVKLIGLFRRDPRDVMFLPVSIIFGYCHGWIKLYSLFTLRMVC